MSHISSSVYSVTLPNIVGHTNSIAALQKQISLGTVAHAYLFAGQEHLGKTSIAFAFAQALVCHSSEKRPCGTCVSCKLFREATHPDVISIERAPDQQLISLEQIKTMQQRVYLRPTYQKYTVVIVHGVESFSLEAANRLLKVLEEPPKQTIFLLLTHSLATVLPTIRSRCQVFTFTKVKQSILESFIDSLKVETKQKNIIMTIANGRPGVALRMSTDKKFYKQQERLVVDAVSLLTEPYSTACIRVKKLLSSAKGYADRQNGTKQLYGIWEFILHAVIAAKSDVTSTLEYSIIQAEVAKLANTMSFATILRVGEAIARYRNSHTYNPDVIAQTQHVLLIASLK